jgi:FimV-like protein
MSGACGSALAQDSYGPVGRETLWSIAQKVNAGRSGTTAQMAWALYRANPGAFDGSPNKIRPNASLKIPNAAFVNEVPAAQAYAYLTGKSVPPAATAAPAPRAAPAPAAPPARAPVIAGVELAPLAAGEPYQWLAVVGSGFAAGAMLELREAAARGPVPARKPQSVRDNRIEYAARFPAKASRWQVVVRNPDGGRSAPYEFEGGASVSLGAVPAAVAAAPVPAAPVPAAAAPVRAFAGSPDQAAAQSLAQAGRGADEVYKLLAPMEDRYAGDVDYDYLLGTGALDSGRFSQAIFVLQRAVATRPGFSGARMELARAYYGQGDNESARREFETLKKENPPPEAARAIAEYLAAIDRRAAVYQRQLAGYAELASGYDSNANGSPDLQTFLGIPLDARNQSTPSSYYSMGLGGLVSYPFAPAWRVVGNGTAAYRGNPDAGFVDSQALSVAAGLEWRPSQLEFSLRPNYVYAMLDGEDNHTVVSVDAAATWHFEQAQVSLNVRDGQTRFVDELSVLDVDTLVYGLAAQYSTLSMPRLQFLGAVTMGTDDAVESNSSFGRDLTGGRVGVIADFGGGHAVLLSVASLKSEYDGNYFGASRDDDQLGGTLGYEWGGLRSLGWTLRAQVNYVENSSNVALYDYDRIDAGLSVRKEFR